MFSSHRLTNSGSPTLLPWEWDSFCIMEVEPCCVHGDGNFHMQKTPCSPEVQCDGILYIVIVLEMEDFWSGYPSLVTKEFLHILSLWTNFILQEIWAATLDQCGQPTIFLYGRQTQGTALPRRQSGPSSAQKEQLQSHGPVLANCWVLDASGNIHITGYLLACQLLSMVYGLHFEWCLSIHFKTLFHLSRHYLSISFLWSFVAWCPRGHFCNTPSQESYRYRKSAL